MNKIFRFCLISAIALLIPQLAQAADYMSLSNCELSVNSNTTVSVNLSGSREYLSYQFDLVLPNGISIAQSGGNYQATLNADMHKDHQLSISRTTSGAYRFVVISMGGQTLKNTSGSLVNITLQHDADLTIGQAYDMVVSSQVINYKDGSGAIVAVEPTDQTAKAFYRQLKFMESSVNLAIGETQQLETFFTPADVPNLTVVSWTSSAPDVVSVSNEGVVTAKALGVANITATASNGSSATCEVTVTQKTQTISWSQEIGDVKECTTLELSATASSGLPITYTITKGSEYATISGNVISFLKEGQIEVTASQAGDTGYAAAESVTKTINIICGINSISLNKTSLKLKLNESDDLSVTFDPEGVSNKSITWSSSNESVATVDKNGHVVAVGVGSATITARSINGKSAVCDVTVDKVAQTISWTQEITEVKECTKLELTATASSGLPITYTITDGAENATISGNVISFLKEGGVTITASQAGNDTYAAATSVSKAITIICGINSISLNSNSLSLKINDTADLTVTFDPEGVSNKNITWTTDNDHVATVDAKGHVVAVGAGKATITATSVNGMTATCSVSVGKISQTITWNQTIGEQKECTTLELTATASSKLPVTYTITSGSEYASISGNVISFNKQGKIEVTASQAGDNTYAAAENVKKTITIICGINSISLNKTALSLKVNDTEDLTVTFDPAGVSDKSITWTTSDAKVATVDEKGHVVAVGAGSATITATSVNGKTATCSVSVGKISQTITWNQTIGEQKECTTLELNATASSKLPVTYTITSGSEYASISGNVISFNKQGKIEVTASQAGDNTYAAAESVKKTITIICGINSIALNKTALSLKVNDTEDLTVTFDPAGVSDKTITWTTSDAKVATVDEKGHVVAVGAGTATITATSVNGKTATCSVSVGKISQTITWNQTIGEQKECTTLELTATASSKLPVTYTITSGSEYASISGNVISFNKQGKIEVTASQAGDNTYAAAENVKKSITIICGINSISLNKTALSLKVNDTEDLTVTFDPAGVSDKSITWTTSDAKVATVDEKGHVVAVGVGSATITATSVNGKTATCSVSVGKVSQTITWNQTIGEQKECTSLELTATASSKLPVTYTITSGSEYASISGNVISFNKQGKIEVTTSQAGDNTYAAAESVKKTITIICGINSIALNKTALSLKVNDTEDLTVTFDPAGVSDKSITWTTSDAKVATVDDKGHVVAVGAGSATITATSVNGKTATCTVSVEKISQTITWNQTIGEQKECTTLELTATASSGLPVTYTITSGSEYASISGNVISFNKQGKIEVTASQAGDNTYAAAESVKKSITIICGITAISLDKRYLSMKVNDTAELTVTFTPEGVSDKTITWTTSNAKVATVEEGHVIAVGRGSATITATSVNGKTASCYVTVSKRDQTITWEQEFKDIIVGNEVVLTATASSGLEVTYEITSGAELATISGNTITFIKDGVVEVTASQNGDDAYNAATSVKKTIKVTTSAIDDVDSDGVKIFARDYSIIIEGSDAEAKVFTTNGAMIYAGLDREIPVGIAGIYVVKLNGMKAKKLVIK